MIKEFIQSVKKNWFALIVVVILIPLAVGLGIKFIDYIPFFNDIPGTNGDWLGFWSGYLGSIIGVGGAYYVMRHQLNAESKRELKSKEPLLVPGTAEYTNLPLIPGRDLSTQGEWFKDLKNFSNVSFPLINGGTTPVFDIKYSYTIENIDEYKEIFIKKPKIVDIDPKMDIKTDYKDVNTLSYFYTYIDDKGEKRARRVFKKNLKFLNFLPVIMPGKSEDVRLPITAIMLLSYSFTNFGWNEKDILPKLKVKIDYKDYQLKDRRNYFELSIQNYSTKPNNAEFRIVPINLSSEMKRPG